MPELMYFFIVRRGENARVIREYADMRSIDDVRPSGTVFEMEAAIVLGDQKAWEEINEKLACEAKVLGITELHNLHPPQDLAKAAAIGGRIRASLHTS